MLISDETKSLTWPGKCELSWSGAQWQEVIILSWWFRVRQSLLVQSPFTTADLINADAPSVFHKETKSLKIKSDLSSVVEWWSLPELHILTPGDVPAQPQELLRHADILQVGQDVVALVLQDYGHRVWPGSQWQVVLLNVYGKLTYGFQR